MSPLEEFSVVELVDTPIVTVEETFEEPSSLPQKFFHFENSPFSDSVNPDFFYRTYSHEAAYMAMKECIEDNVSLGLTTAVSGTGKTLLTQVLLQELDPERFRPALVLIYPQMSRMALLQEIANELGVEIGKKRPTIHDLMTGIQERIMEFYLQRVKLVLIIDEVHFLAANNLQILRTLSNIEIPQMKLVTILLFGEETFLEKLDRPAFKSIRSRLFTRVELRELNAEEVEQYVKYRLLMVHGDPNLFEEDCYGYLREATKGIPREINRLCHNALQMAAANGQRTVAKGLLEAVPI